MKHLIMFRTNERMKNFRLCLQFAFTVFNFCSVLFTLCNQVADTQTYKQSKEEEEEDQKKTHQLKKKTSTD